MSELYWLGVLGNLHDFGEVVFILSIIVLLGLGLWTFMFGSEYDEPFKKIKRMFEAVGSEVLYLKRLRMGSLVLDETLKPGEYRTLTQKEIDELYNCN